MIRSGESPAIVNTEAFGYRPLVLDESVVLQALVPPCVEMTSSRLGSEIIIVAMSVERRAIGPSV